MAQTELHKEMLAGRVKGRLALGLAWAAALLCLHARALEVGDRISTMSQTLHSGYKTSWSDISIQNMPRFRVPDSSIVPLQLPQPPVEDEHKKLHAKLVNPNEDVKFSLTFADHKLILPWTVVFDAAKRRSLQKLVVTFSHDQFDVDGLEFHTECRRTSLPKFPFLLLASLSLANRPPPPLVPPPLLQTAARLRG